MSQLFWGWSVLGQWDAFVTVFAKSSKMHWILCWHPHFYFCGWLEFCTTRFYFYGWLEFCNTYFDFCGNFAPNTSLSAKSTLWNSLCIHLAKQWTPNGICILVTSVILIVHSNHMWVQTINLFVQLGRTVVLANQHFPFSIRSNPPHPYLSIEYWYSLC